MYVYCYRCVPVKLRIRKLFSRAVVFFFSSSSLIVDYVFIMKLSTTRRAGGGRRIKRGKRKEGRFDFRHFTSFAGVVEKERLSASLMPTSFCIRFFFFFVYVTRTVSVSLSRYPLSAYIVRVYYDLVSLSHRARTELSMRTKHDIVRIIRLVNFFFIYQSISGALHSQNWRFSFRFSPRMERALDLYLFIFFIPRLCLHVASLV